MASKAAEEASERKRLSIPKVDASVLEWWGLQHDPGLSVRMLIRAEIERNGFSDVAYRPVAQQPRRGRPPGSTSDSDEGTDEEARAAATAVATSVPVHDPAAVPDPVQTREPELVGVGGGMSPIDAIMNG